MEPVSEHGYIMALDAGTTSVRAILFDEFGGKVAQAQRPINISYPNPGWVEQDPVEILSRQIACMIEVQFTSGIHSDRIKAVGITNQRETVVVWDRRTGQPIYNAIVWQCRRTAPQIDELRAAGYTDLIRAKTGLVPDPYFSGTKLAWILDNVEGAREMAEAGELMCGTIDTWLIYNLTHGVVHATDYTNASRTMLFDIHKLEWDEELCSILRVPMSMLPEARPSAGDYGRVSSDIMTHHPPIAGVAGDQQASLFGHCCFEPGSVKNTYGTGCFMLMNLGEEPTLSKNGLVTTIGIAEGGHVEYALEGSVFQAGSTIQWVRDELGMIRTAAETEQLALSVPDTGGCYIVPAFTGLGAPWWDSDARGVVCGITRGTDRAHFVRAACESMAYQTYDILKAMEADSGRTLSNLQVDGGASRNNFNMQFQSDRLGI
ncbi:MAG: glycerol kinase GlpK, partial [Atopobiaceae bacterium]|nr:glycerol kinase GlpK [Atopobiaceae bacterium]